MPRLHVGSLLFLGLSSCATVSTPPPEPEKREQAHAEPPDPGLLAEKWMLPSRILDAQAKALISETDLATALTGARVIYVGEKHNSPHDHAVQLAIIDMLRKHDPSLAIGLEMVKRPFQGAVDRYLEGAIDDDGFISETEWDSRWGYPFFLYRPILRYAKTHGLRVYALNARDELTRKIAQSGLAALDDAERALIPDLDLGNKAHEETVREVFAGHHAHSESGPHGGMRFENFYAAQVVWDETMAYEVARILRAESPPNRIVVLAGGGHVKGGFGIPARAAKRGATPHKTVLPLLMKSDGPSYDEIAEDPGADFVWLMGSAVDALGNGP